MQDALGAYHERKHFFWLTVAYGVIVAIPLVLSVAIDNDAARFGGGMVALIITLGYAYEMWKQTRLFRLYEDQVAAQIQRNAPPTPIVTQPVRVIRETVNEVGFTKQEIREYPEPPSPHFVEWVLDQAKRNSGRVPSEREIEKSMFTANGDEWMDNLFEQGFVEWVNADNPRLGRKLAQGATMAAILERFGTAPALLDGQT